MERINVGAYLLWVLVLAICLLRSKVAPMGSQRSQARG
jgi:hypothetical protein